MTQFPFVPSHLSKEYYPAVSDRMLKPFDYDDDTIVNPDETFTSQMQNALEGGTVDCYVVTANSAIPVADTVRGFYEEMGQTSPPIEFVRAHSQMALYPRDPSVRRVYDDEVARLSHTVEGMKRVCVIDQYVYTGGTINLATNILRDAGASDVMQIRGEWYHNVKLTEITLESVTSIHSEAMVSIGRFAAQNTQPDNNRTIYEQ
ncbi:MAG TPA: phosphoribosyltransferase [Candidatus Saccharimonadales bacterium]|jgi:phosphoribosylpyrophosphate synthetase